MRKSEKASIEWQLTLAEFEIDRIRKRLKEPLCPHRVSKLKEEMSFYLGQKSGFKKSLETANNK